MEDTTQAVRRKRPNSPKAPGTSLRSAVADVSKVYQLYSHGAFSRSEMASALNMSSGSGAFYGKAATFKEYGLVVESGGSAQVSELFKAIYQAPAGSPELKRNAMQAVRSPAVFGRLLQQFDSRIPEESAIALRLETQERFNPDRAQAVAASFRASLAEYGLIDSKGNLLRAGNQADADADADPDARMRDGHKDGSSDTDSRTGPERQRLEVALRDGRQAVLILPEDFASADARKISALLDALARDYDAD